MNFSRSIPFLARATPSGGGSAYEVVTSGRSDPGFGSSPAMPVPAGADVGDRLLVTFFASNTLTSMTDNQSNSYTILAPSGVPAGVVWVLSDVLAGTIPTTITGTLTGGSFVEAADVYVLKGVSATLGGNGAFSTGSSTLPRSHAYTTTTANEFVFGNIEFPGGGVTGVTGADTDHTWRLSASSGYGNTFAITRPTAGSYGATLGPVGATSTSAGYWFTLAAV